MTLRSLREVAHLRLSLPTDQGWVKDHAVLPVGYSELHLCAHSFPVVVRFVAARPMLGLLVDARYLARPPLDADGRWQAGYMPIAVRCHPFHLRQGSGDPLDEVTLREDAGVLDPQGPVEIARDGRPGPQIAAIHKLLVTLAAGQAGFPAALDRLMIADLLVPLRLPAADGEAAPSRGDAPQFFTVDHGRFSTLKNGALAAMARHDLRSIEIATAAVFSQRLLARGALPEPDETSEPAPPPLDRQLQQMVDVDRFPLALDDGLLFWPEDIGFAREPDPEATPAGPPPGSALAERAGEAVDQR
ncbi:SapC family protein [Rhodoplanes sp. TEM]|uniref:SapC family protein n=1 Tax=Rhodoplanes tepidamans TaxID=200616 RepID=A0ABT5JAS9_RHOTP|nr:MULTISPECIES: SapC family protein [Rhodoplanes]MDC7786701.1 SapC family protein [Rhodoplanes tepidamans]MDC7983707.1 SapC family protein [Rhodoplanes sp. TEM]MDQ0358137.1 hypothetical protein [Rhodoplanes tepidamans]